MAIDPLEGCANELMAFLRGTKRLAHVIPVVDGPALEPPALGLLFITTEQGPVRPSALADALHLDLSTVSRQLAGLESSGWISRERDPDDRRAFLVRVTDEGRRVLHCNVAARRAMLRELLAEWSEAELQEFTRLLGQLNKSLERRHAQASTTTGA
jgi:DNA-binding MarR family transcriptional regulator